MQSLADLSFATLFEYLANKPLDENTKKLFTSYLIENKSIVNEYLSKELVYGIFYRGEDHYVNDRARKEVIGLIKIFGTQDAAYEWIIKNGREIVDEQEDNYGGPIVLTIIRIEPDDLSGQITNTFLISASQHPTFTFSQKGNKMLMNEHYKICRGDWCHELVCDWIYFVKEDSSIIRGFNWEHAEKILEQYVPKYKQKCTDEALAKFKLLDKI